MTTSRYTREGLAGFTPRHDRFVGIDSDGCVFPTMEIKQKQCFHPAIIAHWGLDAIAPQVREAAEFVNLHSAWRGSNRFVALDRLFALLEEHPRVRAAGARLPGRTALQAWLASGAALGNPELEREVRRTGDPALTAVLAWSLEVNRRVAAAVQRLAPFRGVRESLALIGRHADAICVSQTPTEALVREWEENAMLDGVAFIAGQELGTKAEHLRLATAGRYAPGCVLMIGDAPGDLRAAQAVGARFFPIDPGREEASWERFRAEAFGRFLAGTYAGAYEAALIAAFEALLPETPPWL